MEYECNMGDLFVSFLSAIRLLEVLSPLAVSSSTCSVGRAGTTTWKHLAASHHSACLRHVCCTEGLTVLIRRLRQHLMVLLRTNSRMRSLVLVRSNLRFVLTKRRISMLSCLIWELVSVVVLLLHVGLLLHRLHHSVAAQHSSRLRFYRLIWLLSSAALTIWSCSRLYCLVSSFFRLLCALSLHLLQLGLHLRLCLSFVHALINQHVHQKSLLLLKVLATKMLLLDLSTLNVVHVCGLLTNLSIQLVLKSVRGRFSMKLITSTCLSLVDHFAIWSCLPWLVAVVDDKCWFVDVQMCRSGRVIQIVCVWPCFASVFNESCSRWL